MKRLTLGEQLEMHDNRRERIQKSSGVCCYGCGLTEGHLVDCPVILRTEIFELRAALSESIGTWSDRLANYQAEYELLKLEHFKLLGAAKNALECLDSIDKSDDPQSEQATEELRSAIESNGGIVQ